MLVDPLPPSQQAYREEIVRFENGNSELVGVLCLPEGTGPHPVVVFIHGSGPASRDGYTGFPPLWQAFAHRGIASFSWDKPGVGESTGDWHVQTPLDRARESLAALTTLSRRSDIDSQRMGIYGRSQAGWVVPLLAEMTDLIACIILVSVPVSTGTEQELYRIEHQLPADGFSRQDTEKALAFTRVRIALADCNVPHERIVDVERLVEQEAWYEAVGGSYSTAAYQTMHGVPEIFERPVIETMTCPVLAIFGEVDTIVNVKESVEHYTTALAAAGNREVTIVVLPNADHGPFLSKTGGSQEMKQSLQQPVKPFAPGYLELMGQWLQKQFMTL